MFYAFKGNFPEVRATEILKVIVTGFFIIKAAGFLSLKLTLTYFVPTLLGYYENI